MKTLQRYIGRDVLSATLVYQHNENAAAMYEEIDDVSHAS